MTAPPGSTYIAEPLPGYQAGGRTAPTSKRQALRWLAAELGITGAQAHRLVVAYEKDQRDADAREFIAEEFGPWLRRRGDLLVVRGKAKREWRVRS
jgi:hypothetical protein